MGRSRNWPDLRSGISKFRDIRFVGIITLINRWKFEIDRAWVVAVAQVEIFWNMRSLDLTWWPDLEWPGAEIFTQCVKRMCEKVCQKRRRCAPPFLRYRRKTGSGGVQTPPPARRGLKFGRNPTKGVWENYDFVTSLHDIFRPKQQCV